MKAIIILINFALSIIGLCLGIIGAIWFIVSCYILIRADRSELMDKLNEKLGINDL